MQEGSRREEDIIKKIGSSSIRQSEGGDASGDASSDLLRIKIKKQILKELGFNRNELGQEEEIDDELIGNDASLDLYLQIRLERERKEIESIRESNLDRLSTIVDKCIHSEKFTRDSLWKVLEFIDKPLPSSNISGSGSTSEQQQQQRQQRPAHPTVVLSPDTRKRKLASPVVSPKGHKRFASDIPSLSAATTSQSPYYNTNIPGGPAPWVNQQYNQQQQQSVQRQQFEFKNTIPAGLGTSARHHAHHQEAIQTTPVGENQPPSVAQQQFFANPYSPAQFVPSAAPSGYYLPAATATAATAAAQSGRPPPMVMMQSESPPPRVPSGYLQPPQHIPSPYGSTIKQEQPMTTAATRRFQGHRRSQSANVPAIGAASSSARSPVRELHATPQKPVNFLIHTPKHPPPK